MSDQHVLVVTTDDLKSEAPNLGIRGFQLVQMIALLKSKSKVAYLRLEFPSSGGFQVSCRSPRPWMQFVWKLAKALPLWPAPWEG